MIHSSDPLVFEPYLRPQVWGGRRLAALGKSLPAAGGYGESWELSDHPHHYSRIARGPYAGMTLEQHARTAPGSPAERRPFPLLFKYLDCEQLLSVQVHPDDELARALDVDQFGKTEAWVILAVAPAGRVYAGLRPGVTRDELERRLADGTVDQCLHEVTPRPGDCFFLPAGSVHAVGGGVLMAEVQQSSDATFRLFDWNRPGPDGKPRTLHVDQALRAIDWSRGPISPVAPQPIAQNAGGPTGESLVNCAHFRMDRYRLASPLLHEGERTNVVMLLAGHAALDVPATGYHETFTAGATVMVPPGCAATWRSLSSDPATLLVAQPGV